MSLFDEILQGLPVNSLLREKVADLRTEVEDLRAENASGKDDLREARARISQLEKQIESLSAKPALEDIEIQLVRLLAERVAIEEPAVPHALNVSHAKAMHHLAQLKSHGYARSKKVFPFPSWDAYGKGTRFRKRERPYLIVLCSSRRRTTNRWTRAAGACFATSLVRRRVL